MKIAVLTAGKDPHYALGLLKAVEHQPLQVGFVVDDHMAENGIVRSSQIEVYNLLGNQDPNSWLPVKVLRLLRYYGRLSAFAFRSDAMIFHILWFGKFPLFERTLLNAYFKVLGKKLVFSAHNVDDRARDGRSGRLHRLSLRFLYRIVDHILVHTTRMKDELAEQFHVSDERVTVVPHGFNNVTPCATITRRQARRQLGFESDQKVLLVFGNIAPYKGVDEAIRALADLISEDDQYRLIIAGGVKSSGVRAYWENCSELIHELGLDPYVRREIRVLKEKEVGVYFRAADVSLLPYRRIYQSGVLILSYMQGLPVIAADVGSLKEDILEGQTGFVYQAGSSGSLARTVRLYFDSDLFNFLESERNSIREYAKSRFSWQENVRQTCAVYERLLNGGAPRH